GGGAGRRLPGRLGRPRPGRGISDEGDVRVLAPVGGGGAGIDADRGLRLAYPDTAGARLFQALRYLDGGAFDQAREQLVDLRRRFPDGEEVVRAGERNMDAAVRARASPVAMFAQAFFREVRGDETGALEAYRAALAGGVAEP